MPTLARPRSLLVVYGTRPEAIKLASVVTHLRRQDAFVQVVCTGQHRDLLDGIAIMPDRSLDLMQADQSPSAFLARALSTLAPLVAGASQVVVQGDTATAFAATLAAFHAQVPVAHVEAGLRTYRLYAPFPEEAYRQTIDRLAQRLYAPTPSAAENLHREERFYPNDPPPTLLMTGNPGIDAALEVPLGLPAAGGRYIGRWIERPFALVTVHRREAWGAPFASIVRAIVRVAKLLPVVWPVHPNPTVQEAVTRGLQDVEGSTKANLHLVPPMPYREMIATLRRARFVLTDSGGLQEEAPTFGIPALVVREVTERPEAIQAGASFLVGFDEDRIVAHAERLCSDTELFKKMAVPRMLYGDGHAGERIAKDLMA